MGITTVAISITDISRGLEAQGDLRAVAGFSFVAALVFGTIARLKFHHAAYLESSAMNYDGVCSLVSAVTATALFIDSLIIIDKPQAWWLDPTVALFAGVTSIMYGVHAVIHTKHHERIVQCTRRWLASDNGHEGDPTEIVDQGKAGVVDTDSTEVIDLTEYNEDIDHIYLS